jgi:D-sedoheptulose 7-phosphate isomerase
MARAGPSADSAFRLAARDAISRAMAARTKAGLALANDSEQIARVCHAMSARFHRGGKLLVFGNGDASADAQHVAVEFVHPVIVGKRALPAIALNNDVATVTGLAGEGVFDDVFAHQIRQLGSPEDIAMGISADGDDANVLRGLEAARRLKLLTVALCGGDGGAIGRSPAVDWAVVMRSDDPLIVKEVRVTAYHILWELAHVFLDQPGLQPPGVTP